jgi:hypothetical protein
MTKNPKQLLLQLRKKLLSLLSPRDTQIKHVIQDVFCHEMPSNQTMVDIFRGEWISSFPPQFHVNAGTVDHFDLNVDVRVAWVDAQPGNALKGKRIIELGPFEAYNTWQMEQLGAKEIISLEHNKVCFLKCLVVKEMTGMKARFLHGDFLSYLEHCVQAGETADVVWASGVLYHQVEPLRLLALISRVTDTVFIHTHYFDEAIIRNNQELSCVFDSRRDERREWNGFSAVLHHKSYVESHSGATFAGGSERFSFWLTKEDLFAFLRHLGFPKITIEVDTPDHANGPGMCFLAEKV